jgi:hypothetical protein
MDQIWIAPRRAKGGKCLSQSERLVCFLLHICMQRFALVRPTVEVGFPLLWMIGLWFRPIRTTHDDDDGVYATGCEVSAS